MNNLNNGEMSPIGGGGRNNVPEKDGGLDNTMILDDFLPPEKELSYLLDDAP